MRRLDPGSCRTGNMRMACLSLFVLLVMCSAARAESPAVPVGVVRVMQARLPIAIENARRSFQVGDRVQLFQENEEFFIAIADRAYGSRQLIAVPLRRGGRKVAWITPEHLMFFGTEVMTVEGRLYLRAGEELSAIREDEARYEVLVERLGQQATVWISKADPGIRFIPNPVLSESPARVAERRSIRQTPDAADPSPAVAQRTTRAAVQRVLRQEQEPLLPSSKAIEHLFPDMDEQLISFMLPDVPGLDWDSAAEARRDEVLFMDQLESLFEDVLGALKSRLKLIAIIVLSALLVIALIVSGLRKAVLRHAHPPVLRNLVVSDDSRSNPSPDAAQEEQEKQGLNADFSGSVASMSLGAVTQFLNSDKETGTLTITKGDHKRQGSMIFVDGEIVDAQISDKRGVPAVYDLLKRKEGLFAFVRQPKMDVKRTVDQGTISILLDAHRELDEAKEQPQKREESAPAAKAAKKEKPPALRIKRHADH